MSEYYRLEGKDLNPNPTIRYYSVPSVGRARLGYGGGYLLYLVVASNETCFAADISLRQVMSKLWARLQPSSIPL